MIGLVLVTHGRLADEFLKTLEHIVGDQTGIRTVCIDPDDDMELRHQELLHCVMEVDAGRGVIVLTDMFGGTPSNLAMSILEPDQIEVIAGVNMPMLVKLSCIRGSLPLEQAVAEASEAGRKYIHVASSLLAKRHETVLSLSVREIPSVPS